VAVVECARKVVDESGNVICADTGRVLGAELDVGPEWNVARDREKGVDRARASVRNTYTHHAQREHVSLELIGFSRSRRLRALRACRTRRSCKERMGFTYSERVQYDHFKLLNETSYILGIPKEVQETAGMILHMYFDVKRAKPSRAPQIVAAAIKEALNLHGYSLPLTRILEALGISKSELWKGTRELSESGVLSRLWSANYALGRGRLARHIDLTKNFIVKATGDLHLPMGVALLASEIIDKIVEMGKGLEGRRPEAIAGAAVYLAARLHGYRVSQRDVARVLSVMESTIRKQFRFILSDLVIVVKV
jgi:transcription initiation factor TFIIB